MIKQAYNSIQRGIRLLPLAAGLVLLLAGCSVIETISGTPTGQQNASSDAEVVIVAGTATQSISIAEETTTPAAMQTPEQSAQSASASPSPTPANGEISPTTGRQLPQDAVYSPILVAIDNAAQSRPQTALMLADIVYEFPLDRADHSTRYLALFSDTLPKRVGPVRTSRAYLAQTAQEWGGLYVSLGDPELPAENYPLLANSGIGRHVENTGEAASYFYRDKTITAIEEHTTFFQLLPYAEEHTLVAAPVNESRFTFEKGVKYEKGKAYQSIGISFTSSDSERVLFTYDAVKNVLIRSDKNSKKVLGESKSLTPTDNVLGYVNEQITVQNLIVQYVRVSSYDGNYRSVSVTGKGDCMYFVNGRAVFGSWSRPKMTDTTSYLLYDGSTLRLEPGNTWIMMMPSTREIKIRYAS